MSVVIQDAPEPFSGSTENWEPTDVIIRSSDLVDFHTHKTFLSFASPFFKDMFAFPQPQATADEDKKDGKPVVRVTEPASTLMKFLPLFYPQFANIPAFDDLDGVKEVHRAADKYLIPNATELLSGVLLQTFVQKEPYRVFAIACIWRSESLAKAAAKETLNKDLNFAAMANPEFGIITAQQLRKLLAFHQACHLSIGIHLQSAWVPRDRDDLAYSDRVRLLYDDQSSGTLYPWWGHEGHCVECGP